MWLGIAILGNIFLAIVNVFDKFILTKSVPKPVVFVFYSTAPLLAVWLLLPFGVENIFGIFDLLMVVIAGFCFALALWAMYIGFQSSEVSHAGPLLGAATPFFVLLLGLTFLHEKLTLLQLVGIFVLIIGSMIISLEKSRKHDGWHKGMLWVVLAGLLFAFSHVASKYIYDIYGFYSGLIWTRGFIGVFGVLLFLSPSVRRLFNLGKNKRLRAKKEKRLFSQLMLVFSSRTLAVVGVILIQYAIALGSVSIVNAMAGVQFAVLIILVALLSKFWPKLFKESYGKREMALEFMAVLIIALGLILVLI